MRRPHPQPTPEHRTSLCKMPSHRRSCKASVCAIRHAVAKRSPGERSDTRATSREYPRIACAHAGYLLIVLRTDLIRDVPDHGFLVAAVRFIVSNTPGLGRSCRVSVAASASTSRECPL